VRLLCVATVSPDKGHELLIEALTPLAALRWHLTCVGSLTRSTATVERLRMRLRRASLAERVTLVGEVDAAHISSFYQAADAFVLATRGESYGMAVAEAIAHGLPVISTRTGSIADIVGVDAGMIVAPDDVLALRNALERVLREPERRASMSRGAQAARMALSPWSAVCERMAQVLRNVSAA
jgi:glycosyltransferase involved in cell wall biosynthesis